MSTLWESARAERLPRLGALALRRFMLTEELARVEADIAAVQAELMALDRTASLAAQVAAPPALEEVPS